MYAIVETGGKQYKVAKDQVLRVEKLAVEDGAKIKLNVLMLVDDNGAVVTGNPIADTVCEAEVLYQGKGDKVIIFKFRAKKNSRRKQGHRQPFTAIKVLDFVKA